MKLLPIKRRARKAATVAAITPLNGAVIHTSDQEAFEYASRPRVRAHYGAILRQNHMIKLIEAAEAELSPYSDGAQDHGAAFLFKDIGDIQCAAFDTLTEKYNSLSALLQELATTFNQATGAKHVVASVHYNHSAMGYRVKTPVMVTSLGDVGVALHNPDTHMDYVPAKGDVAFIKRGNDLEYKRPLPNRPCWVIEVKEPDL